MSSLASLLGRSGAQDIVDASDRMKAKRLRPFMEQHWSTIEPGRRFQIGWALDDVTEHLEACGDGRIRRLLVNVPPGFCKSLSTSVMFPAWRWGPMNRPDERFLCFSYSPDLTIRDNIRFRQIVTSPRYRQLYGDHVRLSRAMDSRVKLGNIRSGWKLASSVGGVGTGERADYVIIDDPHNVKSSESDTTRRETIRWFREVIPTRLNDMASSAIIIIMQRVHEEDVSGIALSEEFDYEHLMIPLEFDGRRIVHTCIGWSDPRRFDGENAWPERFPDASVHELKRALGKYAAASQLQQEPVPRGGGIVLREWWKLWPNDFPAEAPPEDANGLVGYPPLLFILGSLDTALTEDTENDPSAMTVWGIWLDKHQNPRVMLLEAWVAHLEVPELATKVVETGRRRKMDRLVVENKTAARPLIREMRRQMRAEEWSTTLFEPNAHGDKVARQHATVPFFEAGLVAAPDRNWADMVISEVAMVPRGKHDDLADSCFVQGTMIATRHGDIPIEMIRAGMEMVTPFGFRRVTAAGCTGIRPTIRQLGLEGTARHPVFTLDRSWLPLDTAAQAIPARLSPCDLIRTIHRRRWFSTAQPTGSWAGSAGTTLASPGRTRGGVGPRAFTWRSGKTRTGLFLEDTRFIIGTATRSIAALTTWSVYRLACTVGCPSGSTGRKTAPIWRRLASWLRAGTAVPRAALGTVSIPLPAWSPLERPCEQSMPFRQHSPAVVSGVGLSSWLDERSGNTARPNASGSATGSSSSATSSSIPTTLRLVYNLSVEEVECYYANGVLVHNCAMAIIWLREQGLIKLLAEAERDKTEALTFRGNSEAASVRAGYEE